jgi:hypothetical protein
MGNFVQDNEYDMHMYTKFQDVCKYRYFYTNLPLFWLFSIYITQIYPKIMGIFMDLRHVMRGNTSKI